MTQSFTPPHLPITLTPHSRNVRSFEQRVLPYLSAVFAGLGYAFTPEGDPAALKPEAYILQTTMWTLAAAGGLTAAFVRASNYLLFRKALRIEMDEDGLTLVHLRMGQGEVGRDIIKPYGTRAEIILPINNQPFLIGLRRNGHEEITPIPLPLTYADCRHVVDMINDAIEYYNAPDHLKPAVRAEAEARFAQTYGPQPQSQPI
ncbi:MAG TPA: hypothetical protein PLO23_03270 [Alphaproteobacteria bacterium]|nr:hypothetical protein [Alphaproteobacteria bacterium]